MKSSIDKLTALFFEQSLRHWHFEALVRGSRLSRERVHAALKHLLLQGLILRTKPRHRMPYYSARRDNPLFRLEKRIYGLSLLQESGFFREIITTPGIKTAILFGSFARGDWNPSSDVDLFIFGDSTKFEKGRIEHRLNREIQVFSYDHPEDMQKGIGPALFSNIIKGYNITGTLEPFEVKIHT